MVVSGNRGHPALEERAPALAPDAELAEVDRLGHDPAERQLRRVAIGRKNWLFAGSEAGAERTCILYAILASCRLHRLNPYDYLRDVLVRVGSHPARDATRAQSWSVRSSGRPLASWA